MNVHRWRHLEGADPAAHELLLQTQALQRRLITMTEVGDASLKFTWRLCLAVPDSKMYRAAAAGAGERRLICVCKRSCVPWVIANLRMQKCWAAIFRAARSC